MYMVIFYFIYNIHFVTVILVLCKSTYIKVGTNILHLFILKLWQKKHYNNLKFLTSIIIVLNREK